jgi:hypothetical protein
MNPDPEKARQKLADQYAAMADGELELLAQAPDSLTDEARQLLHSEMARRHIDLGSDQAEPVSESETWADLVVVKEFRDLPEALLAKGSLESAGIECFLGDDNMVRMDWFLSNLVGGVKLSVRPEDADAAVELLEQPLPESFEVDGVGTYEQPSCPQCHSLDVSYETLNKPVAYTSAWLGVPIPVPRKRWKCHSCGSAWQDLPSE